MSGYPLASSTGQLCRPQPARYVTTYNREAIICSRLQKYISKNNYETKSTVTFFNNKVFIYLVFHWRNYQHLPVDEKDEALFLSGVSHLYNDSTIRRHEHMWNMKNRIKYCGIQVFFYSR